MPWQKQYCETEVLERALQGFWAQGYMGVSIGNLIEAIGIHRGSLYTAYDGKRGRFNASLRHREFLARFSRNNAPKQAIIDQAKRMLD